MLATQLAAGKSVTIAFSTAADGADVITGHAYTVVAVNADAAGKPATVTVRNPWGVTDAGGTGNGYVTLTAQQVFDSLLGFVSALVEPGPPGRSPNGHNSSSSRPARPRVGPGRFILNWGKGDSLLFKEATSAVRGGECCVNSESQLDAGMRDQKPVEPKAVSAAQAMTRTAAWCRRRTRASGHVGGLSFSRANLCCAATVLPN